MYPWHKLKEYYEEVLHPAIRQVAPLDYTRWPPSFNAEMFRVTDERGVRKPSSMQVAQHRLRELGSLVLDKLELLDWGIGAFFHHELKGAKTTNTHAPYDEDARREGKSRFLTDFVLEEIDQEDWFIDVGLTYSWFDAPPDADGPQLPSEALFWRKDYHPHLLSHLLGIERNAAHRLVSRSHSHRTDLVASFTQIAGFASVIPSHRRGMRNIHYVNCYTTEKVPTAVREGHSYAKNTSVRKWLKEVLAGREFTYAEKLFETYVTCMVNDYPCTARIEVRIPLANCDAVLVELPTEVLTNGLLRLNSGSFWYVCPISLSPSPLNLS